MTILRKGAQCLVATTFLYFAAVAQAVPPGPAMAPRAPQVMLYISRPMGGGAGPIVKPTFGLRVAQVRQASNNGDPEAAGEGFQHRELLNWQFQGRNDVRLQLGKRVTWDFKRAAFASRSESSAMSLGTPTLRNAVAASAPKTASVRTAEVGRNESAGWREVAALAAELGPARLTTVLPRKLVMPPHPNGQHPNYANTR